MTSLTGAHSGLPALVPPLASRIDAGDTAWLLAASALVLLMVPGLALFYGGMVRSKSVLNMIMMTFGALAAITVIWVLFGYSLAFGDDLGSGLLGDPFQHFGLQSLMSSSADSWPSVPVILFAAFQGLFCVITGALVSGAIADRARFGAWIASGTIGLVVDRLIGLRIDEEHEVSGIDLVVHAETAYDLHATAGTRTTGLLGHRD